MGFLSSQSDLFYPFLYLSSTGNLLYVPVHFGFSRAEWMKSKFAEQSRVLFNEDGVDKAQRKGDALDSTLEGKVGPRHQLHLFSGRMFAGPLSLHLFPPLLPYPVCRSIHPSVESSWGLCQLCPALATESSTLSPLFQMAAFSGYTACLFSRVTRYLLRQGIKKVERKSNGPSLDMALAHQVRVGLV